MSDDRTLEEQARYWEDHALADPLWAVLSDPLKRGRQWELEQFFETGRREISLMMVRLAELSLTPSPTRACDFGCGVGRLSQALAQYFRAVVGVDISPTMIRLAQDLNRFRASVSYLQNEAPDLSMFGDASFSLVYSNIVLQHVPPALATVYVREFMRILEPGGVAVFHLPSHRVGGDDVAPAPATLPPSAYRAQLKILGEHTRSHATGTTLTLSLEVRNDGDAPWNVPAGTLRAGNHWRESANATMLVQDDGRTALPVLGPGEACVIDLTVTVPTNPGSYICELDLVHEGVSWFADQGSQPLQVPIDAVAETGKPAGMTTLPTRSATSPATAYGPTEEFYRLLPEAPAVPDEFPMNGVPRADIEALLKASGGTVRHLEMDGRAGREWVAYRYYVQKV